MVDALERATSLTNQTGPLDLWARGGTMKIWLTVAEAAEYAAVSRDTIYTACELRELLHARLSGRRAIRLRREWIDGWLEQHVRGVRTARSDAQSPIAAEHTHVASGRERGGTLKSDGDMTSPNGRSLTRPPQEYRHGC
jgi:excisionase family DNA binding protein